MRDSVLRAAVLAVAATIVGAFADRAEAGPPLTADEVLRVIAQAGAEAEAAGIRA